MTTTTAAEIDERCTNTVRSMCIDAIQIVVAGAPNAGVSSVVETFGFWDRPMAVVKVEET